MKRLLLLFSLLICLAKLHAQESFQLAPPLLKYSSIFFTKQTKVEIKFLQPGSAVYYTTNGEEPTENSAVYHEPVIIKQNFTVLKAKAIGKNFIASSTVVAVFIKDGLPVETIEYASPAKEYPGSGSNTLIDNKGGNISLSSNTWMGYDCDTVNIMLTLKKKMPVQKILINFLQNEASWIFLPDKIKAEWYDDKSKQFQLMGEEIIADEKEHPRSQCVYKIISSKQKHRTNKISLHIVVKKSIPQWHPAKGSHAWVFIDEVKLY